MTLLTTVFAAIASTIVWYKKAPENEMKVGILCWMYWGASLMWLVDAIFEYIEIGAGLFTPAPVDMLNDLFLGLSVVALGLVIWLVVLLIKDPKGVVKSALFGKKKSSARERKFILSCPLCKNQNKKQTPRRNCIRAAKRNCRLPVFDFRFPFSSRYVCRRIK